MKTCPSCGSDVPAAASSCKHCFYDFSAEAEGARKSTNVVGLLGFVLLLALLALGTVAWVLSTQEAQKVVVDQESQSIIYTRTSGSGTKTDRIPFDRITKVQHVIGGKDSMYEVVALSSDGKRYLIMESESEGLAGDAAHMAKVMSKPYEEVNNVPGFGE
jgi:hypothetical protein